MPLSGMWGNTQPWYWCLSVVFVTLLGAHGVTLVLASSWRRRPVLGIMAVLVLTGFVAQAGARAAPLDNLRPGHPVGRDHPLSVDGLEPPDRIGPAARESVKPLHESVH